MPFSLIQSLPTRELHLCVAEITSGSKVTVNCPRSEKGISVTQQKQTHNKLSAGTEGLALKRPVGVKSVSAREFTTADKLGSVLKWTYRDFESGRYRSMLYRFLMDNVPLINSCVWTWVRLSSAPAEFKVVDVEDESLKRRAEERLRRLAERLYTNPFGDRVGIETMFPDLFTSMYRDGIFGGFLTVEPDGSGVDRFIPVDPIKLHAEETKHGQRLVLQEENRTLDLDRADFYYVPFNASISQPFGRSILQAIPFVTYIEQQLVDDMRRSSHNSGFHRLHVKITPPERLVGESDDAYTSRINEYFDSTVTMIKSLDIDQNPVTWDNVIIEHAGPEKSREVTNSWFMNHRAMIEDICAGTHLAPYLLGYSFGATTTWSGFKFDVVMRQVRSVQAEVASFLQWLGNIDLALAGMDARCRFVFDNSFAYQAKDSLQLQTGKVDNILKLYESGLIDENTAREKAWELL